MKPLKLLNRQFRLFKSDDEGSMAVEALLVFPLLWWWYIASFQFFDALKENNINIKASYAISDLISRESGGVNQAYIDGLNRIFDFLIGVDPTGDVTWIRVTSVTWDDGANRFNTVWSRATKGKVAHTDGSIDTISDRIPLMADGDTAIVVETAMQYAPVITWNPFNFGSLTRRDFANFVVTRPRFGSCIPIDGGGC